jgi:DNA helicase II / ATP-dependent DNA helicase PcrA
MDIKRNSSRGDFIVVAARKYTELGFQRYIESLKYPPNPFQLDVLKSIGFGEGNILVSALAGSGKTTLLMQCAELLKRMAVKGTDVLFLAFNVKIAEEMSERLPAGFTAINSHKFGNQVLNTARPGTKFDQSWKKWRDIIDPLVKLHGFERDSYRARKMLENLCSKAMLSNVKLIDITPEEKVQAIADIKRVAAHFSIGGKDGSGDGDEEDDSEEKRKMMEALIPLVPQVVQKAKEVWEITGLVNFDEMLYLPIALNLPIPQFEYCFVDECQDLNSLQQQLAIRACRPDDGRMVFVGDRMQSIYGFAGADAEAFDNIKHLINGTVLPLNICYRCPPEHLDLARAIVPEIEAAPNAKPGTIDYITKREDFIKAAGRGTLIMNRLTAPLVELYFELLEYYAVKPKIERVTVKMLGKDIAAMLGGIIDKVAKMPAFRYENITEFLDQYESLQRNFLIQREASEAQLDQLADSIRVLQICIENFIDCHDVACLKRELKDLFGDENDKNYKQDDCITLLTVHRAKGLEADHTMILQPEKMPLAWKGQQPWEFEQEMKILYVALTRAKKRLTVFGEPGSLRVNANPNETNARRKNDFEKIEVRADVTDGLPPVKIEEEPIDWSKNRISKAKAFELAALLREGALGDEGEAVEITVNLEGMNDTPIVEADTPTIDDVVVIPEPVVTPTNIIEMPKTTQNIGSLPIVEAAPVEQPAPQIDETPESTDAPQQPVPELEPGILPEGEFVGSADREIIAEFRDKLKNMKSNGGLFGDIEDESAAPAAHSEPQDPAEHVVPSAPIVTSEDKQPEPIAVDTPKDDAKNIELPFKATGNLKADLDAIKKRDSNKPDKAAPVNNISSHKRGNLVEALERITDPKVCETLIELLLARKADLESVN